MYICVFHIHIHADIQMFYNHEKIYRQDTKTASVQWTAIMPHNVLWRSMQVTSQFFNYC